MPEVRRSSVLLGATGPQIDVRPLCSPLNRTTRATILKPGRTCNYGLTCHEYALGPPAASLRNNVRKRFKPHQLVIGIGCFMGLFTLVSGIVPQITDWHDEKSPSREVFGGIPGALQVAFYTVIPVMLVWGAIVFADRVRNWERGAPDRRRTTTKNVKRRLADFRAGVYMRTLLRDSAAGLMHSMIYFGFLALLGVTTVLEVDHQLPESAKFLHGKTYLAYSLFGDLAGLVFMVGIVWAIAAPLRAAAVSHPHQDQARARGHPRHVLPHRRQRASSPRRSASPRSSSRATRSGASSATR